MAGLMNGWGVFLFGVLLSEEEVCCTRGLQLKITLERERDYNDDVI